MPQRLWRRGNSPYRSRTTTPLLPKKMEAKAALLSLLLIPWCVATAQTPLYFSLILSFGRYGFNSSGTIPAMEIALERVDEMQILPGYKLENSPVRDSEVSEILTSKCVIMLMTIWVLNLLHKPTCAWLSASLVPTLGMRLDQQVHVTIVVSCTHLPEDPLINSVWWN